MCVLCTQFIYCIANTQCHCVPTVCASVFASERHSYAARACVYMPAQCMHTVGSTRLLTLV